MSDGDYLFTPIPFYLSFHLVTTSLFTIGALLSYIWLFAILWTSHQMPLSMEFSQNFKNTGVGFSSSSRDLYNQGSNRCLYICIAVDSFTAEPEEDPFS